jgi:hypothetical protein
MTALHQMNWIEARSASKGEAAVQSEHPLLASFLRPVTLGLAL